MIGNIISRRYAKALFAVADKQGKTEAFGAQLGELAGLLSRSPEAVRFFKNPVFSPDEKKSVLNKVAAKVEVDSTLGNFLDLLADKGRLPEIGAMAADFKKMVDDAQGVVSGSLTTAKGIDPKRQTEIKDRLEKQTGRKLELEFAADPEILGGVVLKVGDRVLDASLRAQLNMLKDKIKRGE